MTATRITTAIRILSNGCTPPPPPLELASVKGGGTRANGSDCRSDGSRAEGGNRNNGSDCRRGRGEGVTRSGGSECRFDGGRGGGEDLGGCSELTYPNFTAILCSVQEESVTGYSEVT